MEKTDIVFISPSFAPILKEESIGTLILAKKAQMAGFKVEILRYWQSENFSVKHYASWSNDFVKKVIEKRPTVVSFYCRCTDYHICIDLAKKMKETLPDITIVFGGPQAELVSIQTLLAFEFIDYVACSEGENTIIPFLEYIMRKSGNKEDIAGLCHRNEAGRVVQNPFPSLLPNNYKRGYSYYDLIPDSIVAGSKSLTIDVGRGCPFACTFCSTKTFWKQQFRFRDIEDIIEEMKWLTSNYGISKFDFDHDMFTANKLKLRKFCQTIRENDLEVKWYCSARLDCITTEDIDYMVSAGMTNILFGVETGSPRMQKLINKHLNLSEVKKPVRYAVSLGVKAKMSFMYGFPEETEEDFEHTLRLMYDFLKLGAHVVVWRCGILNGTALYEKYKEELFLSDSNWKNHSFFGFKENIALIKQYPEIFPQFYDHPNELRRKLIYFDLFFSLWKDYARYFFDLAADHFLNSGKRLYDLYLAFIESNKDILAGYTPISLDKFWDFSQKDCDYLVTNLSKYLGIKYSSYHT